MDRRVAFLVANNALKREIKASKRASFEGLCQSADANPWGDAYRVVMAKTRGVMAPSERSPALLARIVEGLFPRHEPSPWRPCKGRPRTRLMVRKESLYYLRQ